VSLLRYVILLKSGYPTLDRRRDGVRVKFRVKVRVRFMVMGSVSVNYDNFGAGEFVGKYRTEVVA